MFISYFSTVLTQSAVEELILKMECSLISMMDPVPGRLEITNRNLYFFETNTTAERIGGCGELIS